MHKNLGYRALPALLVAFSSALSLEAPYLIDAKPIGAGKVELTWRNNSVETRSFRILRRTGSQGEFAALDTVPANVLTYVDSTAPSAIQLYYGVQAESETEVSAVSNPDSAFLPFERVFKRPSLSLEFDTATTQVVVSFTDSANAEIGFRIHRSVGSGPFEQVADIISSDPQSMGARSWRDGSVEANAWYRYKVAVYDDSISPSIEKTIFTFHGSRFIRPDDPRILLKEKVSSFPVQFLGWAIKAGDSILLGESGNPESSYTVIRVGDPEKPVFAGIRASGSPMSRTGFKAYAWGPSVAYFHEVPLSGAPPEAKMGSLHHYRWSGNDFTLVDSVGAPSQNARWRGYLNDSLFIATGLINRSYYSGAFLVSDHPTVLASAVRVYDPIAGLTVTEIGTYREKHLFYGGGLQLDGSDLIVVDYSMDIRNPAYFRTPRTGSGFTLPKSVDGLLIGDSVLASAAHLILDRAKSHVYVFTATEMSIYRFEESRWGPLSSIPRKGPALAEGVPTVRLTGNGLVLSRPEGELSEQIWVYDSMGRRYGLRRNTALPGAVYGLVGLQRGVYFLQSGSPGRRRVASFMWIGMR